MRSSEAAVFSAGILAGMIIIGLWLTLKNTGRDYERFRDGYIAGYGEGKAGLPHRYAVRKGGGDD